MSNLWLDCPAHSADATAKQDITEQSNKMKPTNCRTDMLALFLVVCAALRTPAAPVPLAGNAPVPLNQLRPGNPSVLSMTGTWRFKLEHGQSPAVNGELPASTNADADSFAATYLNDRDWKDIPVPANWEIEGFSRPTFQNRGKEASDDIGLYRRRMWCRKIFTANRCCGISTVCMMAWKCSSTASAPVITKAVSRHSILM